MKTSRPDQGWLTWGVRRSFFDYVQRSGGSVSFGSPAVWVDEAFRFPALMENALRFEGEVSFRAHRGLLSVDIADPWIDRSERWLRLSVTDLARDRRFVVAELLEVDGWESGTPLAATLTAEGAALFAGQYPVGAELAPVSVTLPSASAGSTRQVRGN